MLFVDMHPSQRDFDNPWNQQAKSSLLVKFLTLFTSLIVPFLILYCDGVIAFEVPHVDIVNVAVVTKAGKFVILEKTNPDYNYGSEKTLNLLDGIIHSGDDPLDVAKREVLQQLGLGSMRTLQDINKVENISVKVSSTACHAERTPQQIVNKSRADMTLKEEAYIQDDSDWIYLGKYRTEPNERVGFVHTYVLKKAVPIPSSCSHQQKEDFLINLDNDGKDIKLMNPSEVEKRIKNAEFEEVKSTATLSLALLHLR